MCMAHTSLSLQPSAPIEEPEPIIQSKTSDAAPSCQEDPALATTSSLPITTHPLAPPAPAPCVPLPSKPANLPKKRTVAKAFEDSLFDSTILAPAQPPPRPIPPAKNTAKQISGGNRSLLPFNSINSNESGAQKAANAAAQGNQGGAKQSASALKAQEDKKNQAGKGLDKKNVNPAKRPLAGGIGPGGDSGLPYKLMRPPSLPRMIDCILFFEHTGISSVEEGSPQKKHPQVTVDLSKIRSTNEFWSYLSQQGPIAINPPSISSVEGGKESKQDVEEEGSKKWSSLIAGAKILYMDEEGDWMKNPEGTWGTIMSSALKLMVHSTLKH